MGASDDIRATDLGHAGHYVSTSGLRARACRDVRDSHRERGGRRARGAARPDRGVRARRARRDGHRRAHVALGAAARGRLDARDRGRRGRRLGERRLRRGRALHARQRGARRRRAAVRDLRHQRRRRVRGRPHLRRHPRGVRREGRRRRPGPSCPASRRASTAEEPVAVATDRARARTTSVATSSCARPASRAASGTPRLDDTVGADVLGLLESGTTGFLHYGPEGERLGTELEVFVDLVRARAAHVRLRRDRLLRRALPGRASCSASTSPSSTRARSSRRASGSPTPTRSSSTGRTAGSPRSRSTRAR